MATGGVSAIGDEEPETATGMASDTHGNDPGTTPDEESPAAGTVAANRPPSAAATTTVTRLPPAPGAYRVFGLRAFQGGANESQNNSASVATDEIVFEGFLPEPTAEERIRLEAQEMLRSAITLDESAGRVIYDAPAPPQTMLQKATRAVLEEYLEAPWEDI